MILPNDPMASGLIVPNLNGPVNIVAIPDPVRLAETLNPEGRAITRSWKNIRADRKPAAVINLLAACRAGHCVFVSHSTLSHLAEGVALRYVDRFCRSFIGESRLIGHPKYVVRMLPSGKEIYLNEKRLVSLVWIAHCLSIFLHKAREAVGDIPGLFIHDNLPFNRDEDVEIIRALLHAQDPGRIFFMTERKQFEFAPADNLAAVAAAFIEGRDQTIQMWIWKEGRPRNFYMTCDDDNGTFTRYI